MPDRRRQHQPEAVAAGAEDVHHIGTLLAQIAHHASSQVAGCIVGVVQQLDLEPLAWIVQSSGGLQQPLHHVELVVDGELHRHVWPLRRT